MRGHHAACEQHVSHLEHGILLQRAGNYIGAVAVSEIVDGLEVRISRQIFRVLIHKSPDILLTIPIEKERQHGKAIVADRWDFDGLNCVPDRPKNSVLYNVGPISFVANAMHNVHHSGDGVFLTSG